MNINESERKVLNELCECDDLDLSQEPWYNDERPAYFFIDIANSSGLEIKAVRRACRSLKRKGLADYVRGLFDSEGMIAGSGYCATREGMNFLYQILKNESQQKLV